MTGDCAMDGVNESARTRTHLPLTVKYQVVSRVCPAHQVPHSIDLTKTATFEHLSTIFGERTYYHKTWFTHLMGCLKGRGEDLKVERGDASEVVRTDVQRR